LIEEVRHKDDPEPVRSEPAHDGKQFRDFLLVQTRRRLIQHEQTRPQIQRARNRHHLLQCHRK